MPSLQTQLPHLHPFHFVSDDSFLPSTNKTSFFPPQFDSKIASTAKRKVKLTPNSLQMISAQKDPKSVVRLQDEVSLTSTSSEDDFWSAVSKFVGNRDCNFDCKQVHCQLVKSGVVKSDYVVGNKLALLYLRSEGLLDDAKRVFDQMPERTLRLYAALIGSYCRAERWADAFSVLGLMILDEMLPDMYLVPMLLKACGAFELLRYGKMIHGFVLKEDCGTDLFVGNGLVDFYANCGELRYARRAFDMMQKKDVVSWTALISAYMGSGLSSESYEIFHSMQLNGIKPDLISWNALVSGFARNGDILLAFRSLEEMQKAGLNPRVTSWNGLISGCVRSGYFSDALNSFSTMVLSFQKPNAVTLVSVLPACASLESLEVAKAIHGYAVKSEFCENIYVQGSLIDMYSKFGRNDSMETVFKRVKSKNTALWNELIAAYVNEGKLEAALRFLESMQHGGLRPDEVTYNTLLAGHARKGNKNEAYALISEMVSMGLKPNIVSFNVLISGFQQRGLSREALKLFRNMQSPSTNCFTKDIEYDALVQSNPVTTTGALAACADLSSLCHGKEIHGYVIKNNFESNIFVSSALVDMYAKCHEMGSATKVFHTMDNRNTVTWNSLLSAYITNFHPKEALKLVSEMFREGITPNSITFTTVLPVCGDIEALGLGRGLHGYVVKTQLLDHDNSLASSLIDLYARCNHLSHAKLVFDSVVVKDIMLWNAMISAYSAHGMANTAITSFEQMKLCGIPPNNRTFVALLSSFMCNGLIAEGWKYYELMQKCYGISPNLEHYTCMVSIMGAAGLLEEALEFIEKIPCVPDPSMWATLLQVCRLRSNVKLGEQAEKSILKLYPDTAPRYILNSNKYVIPWMRNSAKNLQGQIY